MCVIPKKKLKFFLEKLGLGLGSKMFFIRIEKFKKIYKKLLRPKEIFLFFFIRIENFKKSIFFIRIENVFIRIEISNPRIFDQTWNLEP